MKRKALYIAIILVSLSSSICFGITPIGQPVSNLRKGWLSGGIDYAHTEIDLKTENIKNFPGLYEGMIEDVKIDLLMGKAGVGLADNWEVFIGLGAAQADYSNKVSMPGGENTLRTEKTGLDGDVSFIAQAGTKVTFYEKALLKAGIACQFTWLGLTGTFDETIRTNNFIMGSGTADIDTSLMVLQVAPGLTYQLFYGFSVYGGPLFQWINGKAESSGKSGFLLGSDGSTDIKEDSYFGGWAGIHADFDIFTTLNVEYQLTGSSGTIGVNLTLKF